MIIKNARIFLNIEMKKFVWFYELTKFMQVNFSWFIPSGRLFWLVKIIWCCIIIFKKRIIFCSSSSAKISSTSKIIFYSVCFAIKSASITFNQSKIIFISPLDKKNCTECSSSWSFFIKIEKSSRCGPICVCPEKISRWRFSRK